MYHYLIKISIYYLLNSTVNHQLKKVVTLLFILSISVTNAQKNGDKKLINTGNFNSKETVLKDDDNSPFTTYYDNGNISEKGTMKDGEIHGKYWSYSENGILEEFTTYNDGWEEGPFKTYWETGELKEVGTYKTVFEDGEYDDTLMKGMYKAYLPSGEIIIMGEYDIDGDNDQIEIGSWIKKDYYDTDDLSNLKIKEDFKYFNGDLHGICKEYYENGKLAAVGEFIYGDEEGIHKEYYENGELKKTVTYEEGNEIGQQKEYNEDGNLEKKGNNGLKAGGIGNYYGEIGIWTYWEYFSNGQLERKYSIDEFGDYQGSYEKYNEDGSLREKGEYKNDEKEGEWYLNYPEDGERFKNFYENGEALYGKTVTSQYDSMEDEYYKIKFKNKCYKDVQVAVRYRNLDGEWTSAGWFNIDAYDEGYLVDTDNRIYYYYAQSTDGKKVWKGDEYKTIRGDEFAFKEKTIPESNGYGDYYVSLTCGD